MKADRIRAEITVDAETKALAVIISILSKTLCTDRDRILKTVCAHFGLRCERQQ